jgi:hypothetical protein
MYLIRMEKMLMKKNRADEIGADSSAEAPRLEWKQQGMENMPF